MTNYSDLLPIATTAVDLASKTMRTMQPGVLTAKGDRDMASEVDYAIEREVRAFLADATPDIHFLGEEEGFSGQQSELMWALDPVDGTVNFVHGSPLCGVSLGLITGDRSVLGVVDLPFLGSRYTAVEHHGAYANGHRIQTSTTRQLHDAVVAIGDYSVGADAGPKNQLRLAITTRLAAHAQRIRMHGSAAIDLVWLAEGKIDAMVMLSNKPWDTAAGIVIAREAGAHLMDRDGSDHTSSSNATIGASPHLARQLLNIVGPAVG
ncbi:inositol monophosphatase family protein [Dactylosporangium aurantiacum]|uniref:inositol-phosphate phosphatase n=1 Tax=Dactylosporangium aurantiacum TaxID=35754 RepID=A0A9Q9IRV8_9ACTN|nr:inositol monophosphatase family protein [Dactylosporangium aurantiacum]MDG6107610.1 inositol monophosphatase family protein [Dactylosporangium aurantiacum]UWZ58790.1 inositol monophosphatase family protein [Dactylosporangium aurantiacum]